MGTLSGNYYGGIVKDGLVLMLDAAKKDSYGRLGTTWRDISWNGNSGVLVNSPTFNISNGGSIVLDGTNEYISIKSSQGFNLGVNFTLQFWVKVSVFGGYIGGDFKRASIITNSYTRNSGQGFWVSFTSQADAPTYAPTPGRETFFISFGPDEQVMTAQWGSLSSYVNKWVNITITVNGNTPILGYINGVAISSYVIQNNGPSTLSYNGSGCSLGNRNNLLEFLNGSIGYFITYNRALSASEVLQNYNATKNRYNNIWPDTYIWSDTNTWQDQPL